jgi:hypothetical protein
MFQLFLLNEDGSKSLLNEFNSLDEALIAAKNINNKVSIEQQTETGSLIIN